MKGVILTAEALQREVDYFLKQDAFAFDIESMDGPLPDTRGVAAHNRVVWLSLATHGRVITIPLGHPNGKVMLHRAYRKKMIQIFAMKTTIASAEVQNGASPRLSIGPHGKCQPPRNRMVIIAHMSTMFRYSPIMKSRYGVEEYST